MACLTAGCVGGTKAYHSQGPQNLVVDSKNVVAKGFTRKSTDVAILHETKPCHFEYAGTIEIEERAKAIGLPVGKRVVLRFNFHENGGFLANYSTLSSKEGVFLVRSGRQYRVDLTFVDEGRGVIFRENGRVRNLPSYEEVCL